MLYYGKIANNSASNPNQEIAIPANLASGIYGLKIFNEQLNGDEKTDYASEFKDIIVWVRDTTAPTLTPGAANRISNTSATVTFTSNEAANYCHYYYQVVENGAEAPTIDTGKEGTVCDKTEQTITLDDLTAGAKEIYIVVKDGTENVSAPLKIIIPAFSERLGAMTGCADSLAPGANTSAAATVYYGKDSNGAPYAWRVIGYNGTGVAAASGSMTLLATGNLLRSAFDSSETSNAYADSTLKTKVEEIAAGLSAGEQLAVVERTLLSGIYRYGNTDWVAGDEVSNALLWPLSEAEGNSMDINLRMVDPAHTNWQTSYWWLRSPGAYDGLAGFADGDGTMRYDGNVGTVCGVRPAFNMKLSSVLFASAAVGGKSVNGMGTALTALPAITPTQWKLTLLDADRNFAAAIAAYDSENRILTVGYSGAAIGANEYISAIVKDSGGSITHYGRLRNITVAADASGTVTIDLSGVDMTGKTLYVFSEQYNGGENDDAKLTDYASELIELDITAPVLTPGAVIRTSDTSATVTFTSDEAGQNYYAVVASGDAAPTIVTTGTGTPCVAAEQTITIDLTAGEKDVYIVVKDASGNVSGPLKIAIPAYVELDTTPPTLTAGAVDRTGNASATVKFTSDEAGQFYYEIVESGAKANRHSRAGRRRHHPLGGI